MPPLPLTNHDNRRIEKAPEALILVDAQALTVIVGLQSTAVPSETAEIAPPLPFQPLRGWNLEQLRPRSATAT